MRSSKLFLRFSDWLLLRPRGEPDIVLPGYLNRWHLIPRNRFFNVYLHEFVGPDEGRHLHDHPWHSLSVCLNGIYMEEREEDVLIRREGSVVFRSPRCTHRIIPFGPVWTLFITGPRIRQWGFRTEDGWVDWETYLERKEDQAH